MENLKEERIKILELLKDGTITPEQASSLLEALGQPKEVEVKKEKKAPFRMLRIKIDGADGEKVRVNIPIEFAKLLKNGKFGSVDFDDLNIDIDSVLEMIAEGASGDLVNIEDEDGTTVSIVVE
ncbi:SHOCT-like domain-containing protein [Acholeplasma hippikon]|uniref:YvlB/LiaX N-terminal domain-containing protein n=1 Tax=Acholeplasma hippikon TaxID=264636 RepID=A0A449BHU0_9MOLU|nr:hypothetical protein [Acholeplasma hippikon]VEU82002.1 Uncharacterised protein [Acholeplasma hippikon]